MGCEDWDSATWWLNALPKRFTLSDLRYCGVKLCEAQHCQGTFRSRHTAGIHVLALSFLSCVALHHIAFFATWTSFLKHPHPCRQDAVMQQLFRLLNDVFQELRMEVKVVREGFRCIVLLMWCSFVSVSSARIKVPGLHDDACFSWS